MTVRILHGDMREKLAELQDASIDAIVTDPPYGMSFMGKGWDRGVPGTEFWKPLLRVAKPGAHLVAFSSSRTFHRMWCAVEDAGWEIRDTLLWLHGEGFPKSSNQHGEWEGWGTALKPAFEPIVLARRPLIGTVAANLAAHRVGALNIDACRVLGDKGSGNWSGSNETVSDERMFMASPDRAKHVGKRHVAGRWPANVMHDGSEEVVKTFPSEAGTAAPVHRRNGDKGSVARFFWCPKASRSDRNAGLEGMPRKAVNWSSGEQSPGTFQSPNTDRQNENHHPTVKPTALMQWLCRLVVPRGGVVLDPFMGSGSTGKAALREGMSFVGIELDEQYIEIAKRRIHSDAPLLAEVE